MAEPKKQDQALRVEPCMNGWTVTPVPYGGNNIMNLPYVFTDRLPLGDFVAEWYREPERVATNRVPFYDGGLNSEGV